MFERQIKTNSDDSPDTERRVLEAAGEVFAALGYRAATVRQICEKAGANIAAVNYYYGDKERALSGRAALGAGCPSDKISIAVRTEPQCYGRGTITRLRSLPFASHLRCRPSRMARQDHRPRDDRAHSRPRFAARRSRAAAASRIGEHRALAARRQRHRRRREILRAQHHGPVRLLPSCPHSPRAPLPGTTVPP